MKVEIKQLTVGYRDDNHFLLALDQVDLTLLPGRITALVGESGSGKTTLAKSLMGLLPVNGSVSGEILLGGDAVIGLGETEMNQLRWSTVAIVFQNGITNLNPVHRLIDQVSEPLIQRLGMSPAEARRRALDRMLEMGLRDGEADRFPHELSGGQIQRSLLAMALILDPDVLILDEPTAALDAMTKAVVSKTIRNLATRQKSILLITHDLDLVQNLADDAAVLYLGQIMEYLPACKLFQSRHPYSFALARSYPGMDAVRDLGGIRGDAYYRRVHAHTHEHGSSHIHGDSYGSVHEDGHAPSDGCLFQPRCTQALEYCSHGKVPFTETMSHRLRCKRGGIAELLHLERISKSYGSVQALKLTDLRLRCGEVFCLVGETGSGKTTLAMIGAGAMEPDGGNRVFEGRDMADWIKRDYKSLASRIGVIYQNPAEAVSHRFTVFDAVAEPLKIQKGKLTGEEIRERVLNVLADVRLSTRPEFLNRYPHELNMGAIQRLCLARSLIYNPQLLVADEPTSALDPSVQAKVLKLLLGLQIEKGLTMLFVTHDIGLARKIADRIGVMLAGRMVEIGPAAKVIGRPGHPYTAMLIDSAKGFEKKLEEAIVSKQKAGTGCPYLERCDRVVNDCRSVEIPATALDSNQHVIWCRNPLWIEIPDNPCEQSAN